MKLTVTQENLSKALQVVGRVASGKTPLPILNNVLLKTENNRLLLAATNLEIAITERIGGKIDKEGAITVPAKLMTEFIANLPKNPVSLETKGTNLEITSGTYSSVIHGMLPDEFPALPEIQEQQRVAIPAGLIKRAIQQTALVASSDDTRPVLTGIYAHSFDGGFYFAATDGYRLAERRLFDTDQQIAAIIPAQTMQDILRVLSDDVTEVILIFDENQVRILLEDIEITSKLIDGTYVDYRQLVPTVTDITAILDKEEFARITKVASLFARESGGSVTLNTVVDKQALSVHSIASQLGENNSDVAAEVNADGQVTLNSRYILEALSCIDDTTLSFSFSGKLSPCVLAADNKEANYKHIIMPLKS